MLIKLIVKSSFTGRQMSFHGYNTVALNYQIPNEWKLLPVPHK